MTSTSPVPDVGPSIKKVKSKTRAEKLQTLIVYVLLILFSLAFIVPFLWLISGSLKNSSELFSNPGIPKVFQWSNYKEAFTAFPFLLYLKNTLLILVVNIFGCFISNTLIAYGFARIKWKFRDAIFIIVLTTMLLPFQVTMVPLFLLFQKLGWIGTFLPLTVPAFFGNPFFIFLLRQFFLGIPYELSESARIDGANEFKIFWRIVLPLSKPAITTVIIFTFLNTWGDFIGPLIFLSNNKLYTLSLGVQQIMSVNDPRWPLLLAVGVSMTLPVLIIFFLMQKYFIQGIAMSGIKE
ncbi:sn-glycerol-3-phosphate transport system permease protein UgpE [Pullulanibacillus camelliae]|uniref:sn-glycerol-3-phosphate transport system permease protein UgpE n=1 Tax=Pullulanibacillus camelliae TaxID=1707096 RepID=A0A8J2YBS9_9BACL|nr:carbohydrate ABC transporter permease [Pullulanibacillus camelliae]GGE28814.1 sn-glycerol-3-phosphate transport system permease protein UgpE [Pullulanibacillus camelliae]